MRRGCPGGDAKHLPRNREIIGALEPIVPVAHRRLRAPLFVLLIAFFLGTATRGEDTQSLISGLNKDQLEAVRQGLLKDNFSRDEINQALGGQNGGGGGGQGGGGSSPALLQAVAQIVAQVSKSVAEAVKASADSNIAQTNAGAALAIQKSADDTAKYGADNQTVVSLVQSTTTEKINEINQKGQTERNAQDVQSLDLDRQLAFQKAQEQLRDQQKMNLATIRLDAYQQTVTDNLRKTETKLQETIAGLKQAGNPAPTLTISRVRGSSSAASMAPIGRVFAEHPPAGSPHIVDSTTRAVSRLPSIESNPQGLSTHGDTLGE